MLRRKINKTMQLQYNIMSPVCVKSPQMLPDRQMATCMGLEDKVVIVTGAGTGIGAATAIAFAEEGSQLILTDRNEKNIKKMVKHCEEKFCAKTFGFVGDVTKQADLDTLVCKTLKKFGKIDVLVNNAGILGFGSVLEKSLIDAYDRVLAVNLRACVYLATLCCPHLVKTKGNVINISSILGRTYAGNSKYMPYCIAKAGLDHFMHGAALELAPLGVRMNNVCPGPTKTEIFEKAGVKKSWKEIGDSFKVGGVSEPSEIADMIVYLASYKARSITGVTYYVDKGHLLMG